MRNVRHALIALTVATALFPTSAVRAEHSITSNVRQLAGDGADFAAQEQALLAMTNSESITTSQEGVRAQLRSVDAMGHAVLDQLERLDVDLTNAIRVALDRLPPPALPSTSGLALQPPPRVVYDAAIEDLLRIAATPDAVSPSTGGSQGQSFNLLVVAVLSLMALAAAALVSNAWHRPASAELAAMAWSDGLTGLANRRRLNHDLISGERHVGTTAVIMIDVDHFKSVNDSFGHRRGDEVLCTIGNMLADQVRHDDIVYRYGGEEFCILLHDSSTEVAGAVADRIVAAARQIQLPDGDHVTVSVGVAESTQDGLHAALESADQALFEAKGLGRDQAVTADQRQLTIA